MTSRLLDLLWLQSWQVSVLFVLVGMACLLLRRASAHWRYLLWLVVLAKCLVPPVMPVALPGLARTTEQIFPGRNAPAILPAQPVVLTRSLASADEMARPPFWERTDWRLWLVLAWTAGGLGYLTTALLKAWRIQIGLKRARTWPDMELECEFLDMAKTAGIEHRPKLCLPGYPIDATDPQDAAARGQIAPTVCGEHNQKHNFSI